MPIILKELEHSDHEEKGILSLCWYRFRMAGYMVIAEALLARGDMLLTLDMLDLMLKDTRRQRKNVSVKFGSPSLHGIISTNHVNSMFAILKEHNINDRLCSGIQRRIEVKTSKNFELSKIRNCNSRNVDVKIYNMNFDVVQDIEGVKKEISVILTRTLHRISNMITVSVDSNLGLEQEDQAANVSYVKQRHLRTKPLL